MIPAFALLLLMPETVNKNDYSALSSRVYHLFVAYIATLWLESIVWAYVLLFCSRSNGLLALRSSRRPMQITLKTVCNQLCPLNSKISSIQAINGLTCGSIQSFYDFFSGLSLFYRTQSKPARSLTSLEQEIRRRITNSRTVFVGYFACPWATPDSPDCGSRRDWATKTCKRPRRVK